MCEDTRDINVVSSVLYTTCIMQALVAETSDLDADIISV